MTDEAPRDFGEETRTLLAAVQEWTRRNFPAPPSGHGGPECQWCPLCQFAAAMRGEHPELTDRLAEAGAAVANALRALAESAPMPNASSPAPRADADRQPSAPPAVAQPPESPPRERPAPRPRVQRITLDEPDP